MGRLLDPAQRALLAPIILEHLMDGDTAEADILFAAVRALDQRTGRRGHPAADHRAGRTGAAEEDRPGSHRSHGDHGRRPPARRVAGDRHAAQRGALMLIWALGSLGSYLAAERAGIQTLAPLVDRLQDSALDLYTRMIDVSGERA